MYDPEDMPRPIFCPPQSGDRPCGQLDLRLADRPALTADKIAAMLANYAGNVTLIDDQIGQLLETFAQRGESPSERLFAAVGQRLTATCPQGVCLDSHGCSVYTSQLRPSRPERKPSSILNGRLL